MVAVWGATDGRGVCGGAVSGAGMCCVGHSSAVEDLTDLTPHAVVGPAMLSPPGCCCSRPEGRLFGQLLEMLRFYEVSAAGAAAVAVRLRRTRQQAGLALPPAPSTLV